LYSIICFDSSELISILSSNICLSAGSGTIVSAACLACSNVKMSVDSVDSVDSIDSVGVSSGIPPGVPALFSSVPPTACSKSVVL